MATGNWTAISGFVARAKQLANPDVKPLLNNWRVEIEADNEYKIMHGLNANGSATKAVTYRPKGDKPAKWTARHEKRHQATAHERFTAPLAAGHDDNLTSAQYRKLAGPPRAPRGKASRVIKNLLSEYHYDSAQRAWQVTAAWFDVVDRKGRAFLQYLFAVRDARGITPRGQERLLRQLQAWLKGL